MGNRPGGPVEAAGAAYRDAKADAFYAGTLRLRFQRRRLERRSDDASKARLLAVVDELRRRNKR
ncbi:MAG TPA: hypothetical protein VK611_29270 [Acidimicrobiales bacterium]|nr:hypothetical protein [Acidimicrobiales bacterium]